MPRAKKRNMNKRKGTRKNQGKDPVKKKPRLLGDGGNRKRRDNAKSVVALDRSGSQKQLELGQGRMRSIHKPKLVFRS